MEPLCDLLKETIGSTGGRPPGGCRPAAGLIDRPVLTASHAAYFEAYVPTRALRRSVGILPGDPHESGRTAEWLRLGASVGRRCPMNPLSRSPVSTAVSAATTSPRLGRPAAPGRGQRGLLPGLRRVAGDRRTTAAQPEADRQEPAQGRRPVDKRTEFDYRLRAHHQRHAQQRWTSLIDEDANLVFIDYPEALTVAIGNAPALADRCWQARTVHHRPPLRRNWSWRDQD